MDLETFAARVARWLRDSGYDEYTIEDDIEPALDDFIRENYFKIVKVCPRFYFSTEEYTGIVDAEDADNELYLLPDDFYAVGNLRRSDITNKPRLRFVGDSLDIEKFHQSSLYPFYDPDPNVPFAINETWTLYDATQFRLVPDPKSSSYTYLLSYYRKWTEAVQTADTVDVPDLALSFCIAGVAADILLAANDPAFGNIIQRLSQIQDKFEKANEKPSAGILPEVEPWW